MAVRLPGRTPRQQAQELSDAHYNELKRPVLDAVRGKFFGKGPRVKDVDLDAAYNLAWTEVAHKVAQGEEIKNLTGLLVERTYLRAFDLARQEHVDRYVKIDVEQRAVEDDVADRVDDSVKLQRLFERLKKRLTDEQANAVALCVLHGYSRPEAAEMLGVSEVRIQKLMNAASKQIVKVVEGIDTRGCGGDEWARVLRAYALHGLEEHERDYERVKAHLSGCGTCSRYVNGLRRLALILPPVLPLWRIGGGHAAGVIAHAHPVSKGVLAHVHRVLRGAHAGAASAGGAQTGTLAGSGAGGGAGTAGLLGGGVAAKTAAVVAVGVVVGVATTVQVTTNAHHHHTHHSAPASQPAPPAGGLSDSNYPWLSAPAAAPSSLPKRSHHRSAARGRARSARRASAVVPRRQVPEHEFGFERTPTVRAARPVAPVSTAATSTPAPATASRAPGTQSGEFGFERQQK